MHVPDIVVSFLTILRSFFLPFLPTKRYAALLNAVRCSERMQQQQHQQRAALFDTPTPPSQSYSQTVASAVDPLQTSLKPRYPAVAAVTAATGAKSHTPFKRVTSTPAAGLLKQQKRSHLNEEMDVDIDSTFTTSDFGGGGGVGYATHTNNENVDPMNRSVGLGNAGNGLGMHDKQRFLDLQHGRRHKGHTGTAARVDEYSDATLDGSTASDTDQRSTSSEEDELAARLGINSNNRQYGQPRGQHQNVSKSAFDGMARELRKEFERIMESGKKPSPGAAAASGISPAQQRRYSLQAPNMPFPSSHVNNLAANPVALPRGVPPPSKQQRASPMPTRTANSYFPAPPQLERRDSTPTTVRTFGQELHVPRQQQQQNAIPSPRFAISPKSALKRPQQHHQQQQQHAVSYATSPFQVSSTAPTSGILPPNNTRATAKSASPVLHQQPNYLQDSFSPRAEARPPVGRATASSPYQVRVPDITGLTEGLTSPSRVTSGPSSHRDLPKDRSSHASLGRSQEGTRVLKPCNAATLM